MCSERWRHYCFVKGVSLPIRFQAGDRVTPCYTVRTACTRVGQQEGVLTLRLSCLFYTYWKCCQNLVWYKINWYLIPNQFRIHRQITHNSMASDCVESSKQADTICPSWHWLLMTCRNYTWSNYNEWNFSWHPSLVRDKKFFRHSFGVAVVIAKLAYNRSLMGNDVSWIHLKNLLVVSLPVMRWIKDLFINKSKAVWNCKQCWDMTKCLKLSAALCKFEELHCSSDIDICRNVQTRVKLHSSCRVNDDIKIGFQLL